MFCVVIPSADQLSMGRKLDCLDLLPSCRPAAIIDFVDDTIAIDLEIEIIEIVAVDISTGKKGCPDLCLGYNIMHIGVTIVPLTDRDRILDIRVDIKKSIDGLIQPRL